MSSLQVISTALALLAIASAQEPTSIQEEQDLNAVQGCSFRADPAEFLSAQSRIRERVYETAGKFQSRKTSQRNAEPVTRRNFIDDQIFGKLDILNVPSAPMSTDEEFVRRIYLDLTGRIPPAGEVKAFLGNGAANKREELIERLLFTPEFADKWAVWFADLIQNAERLSTSQRAPQVEGRNALDGYLRESFAGNKPLRVLVTELITARGNNYSGDNGPANYPVLSSTAMGPAQDTYDMMLSRTATQFLGLAQMDCLLCHSGRGHLTGISLWGDKVTRSDAQRMSAFFSRMRLNNGAPTGARQYEHALFNSTNVQDAATGQYDLNTSTGNRPNRVPVGTARNFLPEYRDGTAPAANENWRDFYARKLVDDPMFHRNFANRVWKEFFGLALVDPVDQLDPARLDPKNPPPSPWTLQATHPELLEKLAEQFRDSGTDFRELVRLVVQSSAYQLSTEYEAEWKLDYVPLFARHYPRRLDAEEIHDALVAASGLLPRYTWPVVNNQTITQRTPLPQSEPVNWAMKLPDVNEPRNNGTSLTFLRTFYRGNRDTAPRMESSSVLQQLTMMNNTFVLDRIRFVGTGTPAPNVLAISRMQDNGNVIDELFLTFLSRRPTPTERTKAMNYLQRSTSRPDAIQDLAWALVNKVDFLFSY